MVPAGPVMAMKAMRGENRTSKNTGSKQVSDQKIDSVLKGAIAGRETKGRTTQYEKKGGFEEALKDFNSMELQNIQNKSTADKEVYIGKSSDGRSVNVRSKSSNKTPTLEIQNSNNQIKIRYTK